MTAPRETCTDCRWWDRRPELDQSGAQIGVCRAALPTAAGFAHTRSDDWCCRLETGRAISA